MALTPLTGTPTVANLKNSFIAGGQEAFHADFRRGLQKAVTGRNGVDVGLWGRGRNKKRGIHFKIPLLAKKLSDSCYDAGADMQCLSLPREAPVLLHGYPLTRVEYSPLRV